MSLADVRRRYDADAEGYLRCWAPVLNPAMQPLLASLRWDDVSVAVEIGCGTGGVLRDIARQAREARVIGVDLSAGMLALNPHRPVIQADAQAIPLVDASVDLAVCGFMLQHTQNPADVVREIARVVRPSGQFALAAWVGESEEWLVEQIVTEELDRAGAPVVPSTRVGGAATDSPDKLRALATAAGFRVDALHVRPLEWRPTVDELVDQMTTMRSTGRRFAQLDPADAERVRRNIRRRLANAAGDIAPPHDVCMVWASKT